MFEKICIIGCGLIGSSIARAIRKNRLSSKIVSSNRSAIINKKVIKLAKKVQKQSEIYKNQLFRCKNSLNKNKYIIF